METKKVKLVYFSPTGTSRKVLEGIAKGTGVNNVEHIDLTLPKNFHQPIQILSDELAIIGAPVYGGRLPVKAVERIKRLTTKNSMAVLIVLYGNREFDDALLELKNLTVDLGFNPIAAGAFIGEHSFASEDFPIAIGRPDKLDIEKAVGFGSNIMEKVAELESPAAQIDLQVPGNYPYEADGARKLELAPATHYDLCTSCETCINICPTAAISNNGRIITTIEQCIRCCACIKACPEGARAIDNPTWQHILNWLNENCGSRKEPQMFGLGA